MPSRLAPTFGQWLVALFLQSLLYGAGILQVYLYFFWYHKDSWTIKTAVILLTIFETFEMGVFFSATYSYLIDGFGDFDHLNEYNWQTFATLAGIYASTLVAQLYFAHTIYRLHQKNKIVPLLIVFLALGALGGGIGQIVRNSDVHGFLNLHETTVTRTLQASFSIACDILITASLCWRLNKQRTGIQSTQVLLNWLIMTAVNRGVLTMLSAVLNLILFSVKPRAFYFIVWILLSGKFYMNSMLATLNTRQYARELYGDSMSMGPLGTATEPQFNVQVTKSVIRDEEVAPRDGKFKL
ncbi:hypothetical protein C8R44DRAFT_980102 [Mycena epipterygia]|nr:hypothetical protein C8R44DRAFT_980102 [Mycena epipterygia]